MEEYEGFFLLILILKICFAFSQNQITEASLKSNGLIGNKTNLPFWMVHNQLGKYSLPGNWQSLTEGEFSGIISLSRKFSLVYGADLALLTSEKGVDPKIIQSSIGLMGKVICLQGGMFSDKEVMGGLSSTNGDLVRSLDYRPYPKVRLSTHGFIPFRSINSKFWLNAEYDEALLIDERIVEKPHLHHKSLMLQYRSNSTLRFILGINHYVFWGGNSTQTGQLPHDLKSYFRYVMASAGGSGFLPTDQLNVAGNQLGSYLLTAEKDFENFQIDIRANHPFEDGSGLGFENLRDNLYAFHFRKNDTGHLLDEWLFEYLYSKHQSGNPILEVGQKADHKRGGDNYFNHGIYQTGFTYFGHSMGTPLFEPIQINPSGLVSGVSNNRVSAFHIGAKGYISSTFGWKGLITYSRNFGTYAQPFDSVHRQIYSMAELNWKNKNFPLLLSAFLALDWGQLTLHQVAIGFQAQWTLR